MGGTNNDTGQDTITGFDLTNDTLSIVATGVSNFVHGTDTAIGTALAVDNGTVGSFTTSTGLVELNQATNNDWDDLGDIAVTFNAPSVSLTELNFEARLQYNLEGTIGANVITTGDLDDRISGGNGNDTLSGGAGNDTLIGGLGQDTMNGGPGADVYVFGAVSESGDTIADRDVISGTAGSSTCIDLHAIDANTVWPAIRASRSEGSTQLSFPIRLPCSRVVRTLWFNWTTMGGRGHDVCVNRH